MCGSHSHAGRSWRWRGLEVRTSRSTLTTCRPPLPHGLVPGTPAVATEVGAPRAARATVDCASMNMTRMCDPNRGPHGWVHWCNTNWPCSRTRAREMQVSEPCRAEGNKYIWTCVPREPSVTLACGGGVLSYHTDVRGRGCHLPWPGAPRLRAEGRTSCVAQSLTARGWALLCGLVSCGTSRTPSTSCMGHVD